jgi:hypothetical protein
MKERDFDREEMAAQTVLFQKNINQVNECVELISLIFL